MNGHYEAIRSIIKDYTNIDMPYTDVETIMGQLESHDPEFWKDEYENESYSDTLPRDIIFDGIVSTFIGEDQHWPLNGDSDEYSNEFFKQLQDVSAERKWSRA